MVLKIAAGAMAAAMLLGGAGLAARGSSTVRLAAAVTKAQDPKCPTGATTVTVDGYATAQVVPNEITSEMPEKMRTVVGMTST